MNNNIIVTLKSSTTEMNLNSHEEGIYLIPDLEGLTSIPEIRTSSGVNAGADGGWTSAQFFDARSIAMKVVISNEDVSVVEQKRQALNSLLAQGRKEDLLLTVVTEAGNAYTVYVRPTSVSSALNQVLKAQEMLIQFRADDPLIYGEGSSGGEEAILHVQQALGGFAIPFKFPLAIGGGSGATTITNSGSESVYPIITLEGPLHSPTVINRTTNQQIQVLVDLASIINWAGEETAQGNYIQVNNQLDIPTALKSAELLGDASQTTYSGKNLADYLGATYSTQGVSITKNATNIVITKNTDGEYRYGYFKTSASDTNKMLGHTITLSFNKTSSIAGRSSGIRVFWVSSGGSIGGSIVSTGGMSTTNGAKSVSFSVPATIPDNTYPFISLLFYPDMSESDYASSSVMTVSDVQLELGSTATAYEPYVGGTASPNPDYPQAVNTATGEQTVKITGKNLLEPMPRTTTSGGASYEWKENGDIIISGTTTGTSWFRSAQESTTQFDAHLGAGTYAFTVFGDTIGASFRLYDETGAYIATTQTSTLFTLTEATKVGLQIRVASGTTTNITAQVQLELAHNSFEPSYLPTSWTNTTAVYETLNLQPNTTYTMSSTIPRASGNALLFFLESGQSIATNTNGIWDGQTRTLTTNATGNNLQLAYRSFSGETRTRDDYDYALLSATEYEPYQGQTLAVNLGKNLLQPMTGLTNSGLTGTTNADGTINVTGTASSNYSFFTDTTAQNIPAGTYTFSDGLIGQTYRCIARFTYSDNTYVECDLRNQGAGKSFTLTKTAVKCQIRLTNIVSGTTYNLLVKPQVEKGSTATTYAPYFTPIELAKIGDYQDRIYKSNGKWFIEKRIGKVVLDGTEDGWDITGGGNGYRLLTPDIVLTPSGDLAPIMSDYYTTTTFSRIYNANIDFGISNHNSNHWLAFRNKDITSLANFKTWLSTHNTTVYYALATPITTEITNTALIAQLDALMGAQLYVGTNNVSTSSEYAPAILDISFFTEYTRSIDKVVIDSQLQTVTLNGLDIYHQLSESSEFITIAPGENEMILTSTNTSDEGIATIKFKQGYLSI